MGTSFGIFRTPPEWSIWRIMDKENHGLGGVKSQEKSGTQMAPKK